MFAFRWSIPLGARRVMDAVKEGHKSGLSSGKMVALAAGLSVGATVGYMIYRHISSTDSSEYLLFRATVLELTTIFFTKIIYNCAHATNCKSLFSDDLFCDELLCLFCCLQVRSPTPRCPR